MSQLFSSLVVKQRRKGSRQICLQQNISLKQIKNDIKNRESEQKTRKLLSKSIRFLHNTHQLNNFKKKILLPVRKTLFQSCEQKIKKARTDILLRGGIGHLAAYDNKKHLNQKRRKNQQHSIYDQPITNIMNKSDKYYSLSKNKTKKYENSKTKIQQMTQNERIETITAHQYHNQEYLFIDQKNQVTSVDGSQFGDQQLNPTNSINNTNIQVKLTSIPRKKSVNRERVKSLTKNDTKQEKPGHKRMISQFSQNKNNQTINSQVLRLKKSNTIESAAGLLKLIPITTGAQNSTPIPSAFSCLKSLFLPSKATIQPPTPSNKPSALFQSELQSLRDSFNKSNQQYLLKLLGDISKDGNKDTIRIYKEDFNKIYNFRYGKDKITTFFDYQYIEDYDSLDGMFKDDVLNMNRQEVLLVSYIMLDQDSDGLITHSDLFKLLLKMNANQLVKNTIFQILQFVKQKSLLNDNIKDTCQQDFLKRDNLTLKKFKFMTYMKQKKKTQGESTISMTKQSIKKSQFHQIQPRIPSLSPASRLQQSLFTLQPQSQVSASYLILKSLLQSLSKSTQSHFSGLCSFSMNYTRFKQLFCDKVPQIYYDILYSAFGYRHLTKEYQEIDVDTPLFKQKKQQNVQYIDQYQLLLQNLNRMRDTNHQLNQMKVKVNVEHKRFQRIKSTLS